MKSKLLSVILAAALLVGLTACSSIQAPAPSPSGDAAPSDEAKTYTVGICQLAPHAALDAATQGFKDALTEALGASVTILEGNAGGDANNCITIIDGYVSDKVDLIMANATSPLQTAASATADIPILGTSVTNYAIALSMPDDSTEVIGGNISGTSDLAPLDQQAAMLQELFPEAKNVGLLYCSAEPNSVYQIETISDILEEMGYSCTPYAFTDVNDLASVTQTACDDSDVIYIPTDNTAANNTESIANVVLAAGVPVVAGESGICSGCGVVSLSIDYYELGRITGSMAAEVLTGEADISTMPVRYAGTLTKMYNAANCELLGISIPEDYTAIEN